ncbi:DUF4105 domain-containing protein [Oceanicoccus sagamiensis]|uniref:Lnb N-terminal periplasmic domain-containing protein n=1 Tax=Oceanicoccus sagamiensis TaxID=716816 RepID=UPI00146A96D6|nr:DUF4105 domain-containing protein [Oceanicoccus sagamiensis]
MKLLSLLLIFFSASVHASLLPWLQQAERDQLAQQREWLNLLHYKSLAEPESFVDDDKFFLAANGYVDPAAELQATITAFYQQPVTQCRFVARRQFLLEQLPGIDFPIQACAEYQAWRDKVNAHSVVLVFASSYLNSPSSMYGHTFLRFDPVDVESGSTLLSYALNFGANADVNDNSLLYAYKGLFGGYEGMFAAGSYIEKVKEYSRLESRDLWEYRLNLEGEEIDRLMAHIWELNLINFDYYFFDENCSFRLLELMEVARPSVELTETFPVVAIPIDTVRIAEDNQLIDSVVYRPSRQVLLAEDLSEFSEAQKAMVLRLMADPAYADTEAFLALEPARQRALIDSSYRLLRYDNDKSSRDSKVAANSFQLLKRLTRYDKASPDNTLEERPVDPLDAHDTMLVSPVVGYEEDAPYVDLVWRYTYHDLLDNSPGYPRDTSLNMAQLVLRAKKDESLQLQRFDILEINSLAPRNEFFKPMAWRVNAGWERQWTEAKDQLVPQVNGGLGASYRGPLDGRLFAMVRGRVEYNEGFDNNLDAAPGIGVGYLLQGERANTLIEAEHYEFIQNLSRSTFSVNYQWMLSKDSAIRIGFKRNLFEGEGINETSIGYRAYF